MEISYTGIFGLDTSLKNDLSCYPAECSMASIALFISRSVSGNCMMPPCNPRDFSEKYITDAQNGQKRPLLASFLKPTENEGFHITSKPTYVPYAIQRGKTVADPAGVKVRSLCRIDASEEECNLCGYSVMKDSCADHPKWDAFELLLGAYNLKLTNIDALKKEHPTYVPFEVIGYIVSMLSHDLGDIRVGKNLSKFCEKYSLRKLIGMPHDFDGKN